MIALVWLNERWMHDEEVWLGKVVFTIRRSSRRGGCKYQKVQYLEKMGRLWEPKRGKSAKVWQRG